jgi:hypothetical protein
MADAITESKPEISQAENTEDIIEHHQKTHNLQELAAYEIEPQTPYQLGWRTILAVLTLSMGNVCAALANTVSSSVTIYLHC